MKEPFTDTFDMKTISKAISDRRNTDIMNVSEKFNTLAER